MHLWLCLVFFHLPNGAPQRQAGHARISLVLGQRDSALLLTALLDYYRASPKGPLLITAEPGPLVCSNGLRLLANEIPPNLSQPDILILSNLGELDVSDPLLAFTRACLFRNIPIWVIGEDLPRSLKELLLEPGMKIELFGLSELRNRLAARLPSSLSQSADEAETNR